MVDVADGSYVEMRLVADKFCEVSPGEHVEPEVLEGVQGVQHGLGGRNLI